MDDYFIVESHDHIGILDVVNPGDMLIADALDPVRTKAVFE